LKTKVNTVLKVILIASIALCISTPTFQVLATDKSMQPSNEEVGSWKITVNISNLENSTYEGKLKIYVVEPESRWNNYDEDPYHYALIDFAYDEEITVNESLNFDVAWNPGLISNVDENNLMVIATVFNGTPHQQYAYGENYPFDAHYVDATAASSPDKKGYNRVTEEFTHTVFAEEGTATWCRYCPQAAEALMNIYESEDYPFYFVALVGDKNDDANDRLKAGFNIGGYPTTFFDGGYSLKVGSSYTIEQTYREIIETCGQREVPQLNLSVLIKWDPDETPPSVEITKPKNGLFISNEKKRDMNTTIVIGTIDITAEASDEESDISRVEFFVNGELRNDDEFSPYKFSNWKENKFFGKYDLKVIAYDEAENKNIDEIQVFRFF